MPSTPRTRCRAMSKYDVFGGRIVTEQGDPLAVVGLCRSEEAGRCRCGLNLLRDIRFSSEDPEDIDRSIAERLAAVYEGIALAVGATVHIGRVSQTIFRTGGVLGCPDSTVEDAESELETLDDGIWMYTASGGPGWLGFFSREKAELLARFTLTHHGAYPVKANEVYRRLMRLSPDAYLFISDGTGYDSLGLCAAKCGEKELGFIV